MKSRQALLEGIWAPTYDQHELQIKESWVQEHLPADIGWESSECIAYTSYNKILEW